MPTQGMPSEATRNPCRPLADPKLGTKCPVCLSEYENVFMHGRRTFVLLSVPTGLLLLGLASLLLLPPA